MSSPSISVMKFGTALIFASHLRQSCSFAQYCASFCIVANCTPCVASATCSRSGHFVAAMRLRKSARSASGTLTRKGRIAVSPAAAAICAGSRLTAPAAADAARKLRRPSSGNLTVSMDDSPWSDGRLERRGQGTVVAFRFSRSAVGLDHCRVLLLAFVWQCPQTAACRKSVGGAERGIFRERSLSDASLRRLRRADYHSEQRLP